jgi:hypothetical protein
MKPQPSIHISIPNPCTEKWDEMASSRNGKYCAHCQKTVVDYTWMSDAALLNYIQQNGLGCGRFLDEQLERVIEEQDAPKSPWWKHWWVSLGVLLGTAYTSKAQHPAVPTEQVPHDPARITSQSPIVQDTLSKIADEPSTHTPASMSLGGGIMTSTTYFVNHKRYTIWGRIEYRYYRFLRNVRALLSR